MIYLDRSIISIPKDLLEKSKRATAELEKHITEKGSQIRPRYNNSILFEYKDYALKLSQNKCSYCESYLLTTTFGDIENFRPRSPYWWLTYEWNNLLAACSVCNQKYKSNLFPISANRINGPGSDPKEEQALLIDPAFEDPEMYFDYVLNNNDEEIWISPKPGDEKRILKAQTTIDTLGLNRLPLLKSRYSSVTTLIGLIKLYRQSNNKNIDNQGTRDIISKQISHTTEHLGAKRFFVKKLISSNKMISTTIIDTATTNLNPSIKENKSSVPPSTMIDLQNRDLASHEWFTSNPFLEHQNLGSLIDDFTKEIDIKIYPSTSENIKSNKRSKSSLSLGITYSTLPYLKGFSIRNFKAIRSLKVDIDETTHTQFVFADFENNSDFQEKILSWTLILGENGVGKSTILEALALGMIGEEKAREILPKLKAKKWINRDANTYSKVEIRFADNTTIKYKITKGKGITFDMGKKGKELLIKGYGHVRLIRKDPKGSKPKNSLIDVGNLFNPYYNLCDVQNYFKNLSEEPIKEIGMSAYDYVMRTLRDVLPEIDDDEITKDKDGNITLMIAGKATNLNELSSGYQAIIALVIDIISSVSPDKMTDMQEQPGIIFLDEIGSQLHPSWRMRVVRDLRKAFPRMQFIATTHEPLCLRGIATEEVIRMSHSETKKLNSSHPDIRDLRIDQLLTSPLFGLHSTIDPTIDEKFSKYYALLESENPDPTELQSLRGELSEYNSLGYTRRDQLVYDIIDKHISKNSKSNIKVKVDEDTKKAIIDAWQFSKGRTTNQS